MKLHQILIGIVLTSLMVAGFVVFIGNVNSNYAPSSYNSSELDSFNKMSDVNLMVEQFNGNDTQVNPEGTEDILGGIFASSYRSAQTLKGSASTMVSMVDDGVDNLPLSGGFGGNLKLALGSVIMIVITIAIFLHFITKSERT